MAEAKPLTAQHSTQNTRRRNWKTPRDGGPPPPTATEHKQETPHIETCGQGARGTSPHAHCIGHRPPTVPQEPAQIVSGLAVHSRYRRQPVHGVQATRWFARAARTTVTAANDAHRDGWMRAGTAAPWPRRGPSRRGGGPDWEGCEGKSAARARCGEEQKAGRVPRLAERPHQVAKGTQKQRGVPVSGLCEPVCRVAG